MSNLPQLPQEGIPFKDDLMQRVDDLEQMVIDLTEVCIAVFNKLSYSYAISSRPDPHIAAAQLRVTRWGRFVRSVRQPREWPRP